MNLLPKSKEEFSEKEYWEKFFKKRGTRAFEWYGEYHELSKHLHKYLKPQESVLIAGCGNSTLGRDLYDVGCRDVTNIDISTTVIKQMLSQNDKERPGLKYIQMDALHTSFNDESFNVVIDKGTLDALMPDSSAETENTVNQYFSELQRILKITGRYICISLLQEHILKKMLNYFPANNWMFRAVRCFESEVKSMENGENLMPVFIVICTKFKSLPRKILEINLGIADMMQKCESIEEVINQVTGAQKAAIVCSALRKSKIGDDDEVSIALYEQGNELCPRYTVYIVENSLQSRNCSYAAFIVPEGREAEWLFATKAGRKHLLTTTKYNRLMIVTLHRGQSYKCLDNVKKELESIVCTLAPSHLNTSKIPFLTLGSDLGNRTVRYEGVSFFSGNYVIEDVEHDDGERYRRLFYMNSQLVIQSEAKLKSIKPRGGKKRNVIDLNSLTCQHHIYMSIGAHLAVHDRKQGAIAVLGLGGGGLCSFLHKFLPNVQITGVDIDSEMLKIATQWFDFKPDDNLKAKIQDGLDFIRDLNTHKHNLNAILVDVDNKSANVGMSCPPQEFLMEDTLRTMASVVAKSGVVIINIVLRDQMLRPGILASLKKPFKNIFSYKLTEDLNEIFICSNMEIDNEQFKRNLKDSCEALNVFFKRNGIKDDVQIDDYINSLKIGS